MTIRISTLTRGRFGQPNGAWTAWYRRQDLHLRLENYEPSASLSRRLGDPGETRTLNLPRVRRTLLQSSCWILVRRVGFEPTTDALSERSTTWPCYLRLLHYNATTVMVPGSISVNPASTMGTAPPRPERVLISLAGASRKVTGRPLPTQCSRASRSRRKAQAKSP